MSKRPSRTFTMIALAGALGAGAILLPVNSAYAGANDAALATKVAKTDAKIQIAILLDTSSSMDGLIDQAKSQLWKIVNEVSGAQKQGKKPRVEIALYEYGKSSLAAEGGYIRKILPFTTDLDRVSEELFALRTNGGEEYCGMVIQKATKQLEWSASADDLKIIYIAGNEPFTQGPVDYHKAIGTAVEKHIAVNVIHCGGDEPSWRSAAQFAHGDFLMIDQNKVVAHVAAPQDEEIARLGNELNRTYLAYGARGREAAVRQEAQDKNAASSMGGASVQRAATKASGAYDNSSWDLVDGTKKGTLDLAKAKEDDLPDELRKLPPAERKAYVDKMAAERARLQGRIAELAKEREKFVATESKKHGDDSTFDAAVNRSLRKQAEAAGYSF